MPEARLPRPKLGRPTTAPGSEIESDNEDSSNEAAPFDASAATVASQLLSEGACLVNLLKVEI